MNRQQAAALAELQQKTIEQIQVETAYAWAYRSWAAKELGLEHDSTEYFHESVEHAALTGDDNVLRDVRMIAGRVAP